MRGRTVYSPEVPGARGNYGWPVRFDRTSRYVGITQSCESDNDGQRKELERVLLSPKQITELLNFVGAMKKPRRRARTTCYRDSAVLRRCHRADDVR